MGALEDCNGEMKNSGKLLFITGTDTGVGKTLLTALLLQHLRSAGVHALAMKPFCSGTREDVELLQSLQADELANEEMNPFYFAEAVAPAVARDRRKIALTDVVKRVRQVGKKCEVLLVEGSGGLLVPLAREFDVRDLIRALKAPVALVARNRLGTINHTLLTLEAMQGIDCKSVTLMAGAQADLSVRTNDVLLQRMVRKVRVLKMPFLGVKASRLGAVKREAEKQKKTLEALVRVHRLA